MLTLADKGERGGGKMLILAGKRVLATNYITDKIAKDYQIYWFFSNSS